MALARLYGSSKDATVDKLAPDMEHETNRPDWDGLSTREVFGF